MSDVNRSKIILNLTDVRGRLLSTSLELKLYNQQVKSLNQLVRAELKGAPVTVSGVPAFPVGLAEAFLNPAKYRFKSVFVNVPAGKAATIDETFFADPEQVRGFFPGFGEIQTQAQWKELWRILQASGVTQAAAWNALSDFQKAGVLNLYAKTQREALDGSKSVASFVDSVVEFHPSRVFAVVQPRLLKLVRGKPEQFHPVSGALHEFKDGWKQVEGASSFKTHDPAGNLQLTFAQKGGEMKADIDIDDHQGLKHVGDVLKHKITGKDTHPYDIHEILIFFQQLDPGYELG